MMRKLMDARPRSSGEAEREIQANQEMKHNHFGGLEIVPSCQAIKEAPLPTRSVNAVLFQYRTSLKIVS